MRVTKPSLGYLLQDMYVGAYVRISDTSEKSELNNETEKNKESDFCQ